MTKKDVFESVSVFYKFMIENEDKISDEELLKFLTEEKLLRQPRTVIVERLAQCISNRVKKQKYEELIKC